MGEVQEVQEEVLGVEVDPEVVVELRPRKERLLWEEEQEALVGWEELQEQREGWRLASPPDRPELDL